MKKIVIAGLGILMVTLGIPGMGVAQNWIQIQGTIQAVDCQTNALVLNARDGTHVLPMAPHASVTVNSATLNDFCALRQYVGSTATVSLAADNPTVAAGVDVAAVAAPVAPASTPPGPPTPAPAPGYGYYGPYYPYPYYPYYAWPYCYGPYSWTPYYGWPYCYGPYSGYVPYYGPAFGIGIGIVFGPGFRHHGDRRFVGTPGFHGGNRRFVVTPRFHGGDRRFVVTPGFHGGDRRFVVTPRFHGGDRRFVVTPRFHGGDRRFIGGPGGHGPGGPRR